MSRIQRGDRLLPQVRLLPPLGLCLILAILACQPAHAASDSVVPEPTLPDELPPDIVWLTNDSDPVFASPEAVPGGTFRTFMLSFPLTLRQVGPDSNGAFAAFLRYNQLGLVSYHPNTRRPIPSLASHWAFGDDGRTVFYRIDEDARWSDGVPVTADDFLFTLEFMRSSHIVAPWYNNYYTTQVIGVKKYAEKIIGIQGASAKPQDELLNNYGMGVVPSHFHVLDENWVRDYNWRIEPNTGPYQISDVKKGRYIEYERKDTWWANDRRFYRHRFNPQKIRVKVIRDINIAYQHFLKGELDTFGLVLPEFWHEKAKGRLFDAGYINRYWFYNDLPQPSSGMFLNEDDPILADRNVRIGLAHAMNLKRVIDTVLRGDYERLETFQEGFGEYDNREIKARRFDLEKAREHLAAAGWVERGPDGILVRDGVRLELRVTYGSPHHTPRLVILKEEARKAGIDLVLQLMDSASSFKQMLEKKHQIAWMGWGTSGLSPRYWEHFHSVNAHRPQTNNITNHDDPEMDSLIDEYRASTEKARRVELARTLEQMVHDSGAVIPTFKVPYTREAAWRWVRLPEALGTRTSVSLFNPLPLSAGMYSAGGLFWLDVPLKQEIRDARASNMGVWASFTRWLACLFDEGACSAGTGPGKTYPPVLEVNERYRR